MLLGFGVSMTNEDYELWNETDLGLDPYLTTQHQVT